MYPRELLEYIHSYILDKGFIFSKQTIANLYLSLRSKPFVILAGISGTGKTQLVKLFAETIGHKETCYLVPVRPDWTDSSFILGFHHIDGAFMEGQVWKILEKAYANLDTPFFVLLDEMNMARVEYYLS